VPVQPQTSGLLIATVASLKLLSASALGMAAFGGLNPTELAQQLQGWGLSPQGIAAILGALTIWPEVRMRARQILEARYARGLLRRRSLFRAALALPFILRPLLTSLLRAAILRAEAWEQRGLLTRLRDRPASRPFTPAGVSLAATAFVWASAALWTRLAA
jgi:hypothetical protein